MALKFLPSSRKEKHGPFGGVKPPVLSASDHYPDCCRDHASRNPPSELSEVAVRLRIDVQKMPDVVVASRFRSRG